MILQQELATSEIFKLFVNVFTITQWMKAAQLVATMLSTQILLMGFREPRW